MITVVSSPDTQGWDQFVHDHPHGTIFQTSAMAKVYGQAKNYEPISLAAIDTESGEILALLQSAVISEMGGVAARLSGRSVVRGAPLVVDGPEGLEAAFALIEHYDKLVKHRVVYSQIRNMWDTSHTRSVLESSGYVYDEHLNYLIDLDRDTDAIWADISKSRRKGVNRAAKAGIETRRIEDPGELTASYELIHQTYMDVNMPVADMSLFRAIYDEFTPAGMADFFIAIKDDTPVGARITLNYKDLVFDWYAGSQKDVPYVDEALVWHILKENAQKYKVFDFGGAGHPDKPYGVREFKRRFGGEQVNFGRYKKVHGTVRNKIAEMGYGVYRRLK